MSSPENQPQNILDGLQIPGLVLSQEPVEQLSFAAEPLTPVPLADSFVRDAAAGVEEIDTIPHPAAPAGMGEAAAGMLESGPRTTGMLQFSGGSLPGLVAGSGQTSQTTALRRPVVIRGSSQPRARSWRPPQGRRHVISLAALLLLLVITGGMLFAVSPLGRDVRATFHAISSDAHLIAGAQNSMSLLAQATATAIVHQQNDGLDPSASSQGPTLSPSNGSLSWPYGVCTYWANLYYHQLSGRWVSWHGNAYQWADGARLAGWNVSTSPRVPSIIVLMPGVQGASGLGHVAVVVGASGNVAHTSNMNWYVNGGGYGRVSSYDFTAGSGVYFIWAN